MGAWRQLVGVGLCVGAISVACGGGTSGADGSCQTGSERCPCYANLTCDSGLKCLSELCVDEDDEGSGGSGAGGSSSDSGGSSSDSGGSSSDSGGSSSDSGGSSSDSGGTSSDSGGSTSSAGGSSSDSGGTSSDSGGSTSSAGGSAGDGAGGNGSNGGSSGSTTTTTTDSGGAGGSQGGSAGAGGGSGAGGSGGTGGPIEGNLIQNGDFSDGDAHWLLTWGTYPGAVSFTNGEYCVENLDYYYLTYTLGYPLDLANAFAIESGASYTLRYRVKGYATYEVKIGQAVEPYAELVSVITTSTASSSYVPEVRTLVGAVSDPQAGLALNGFLAAGEYLCFDDISLVQD